MDELAYTDELTEVASRDRIARDVVVLAGDDHQIAAVSWLIPIYTAGLAPIALSYYNRGLCSSYVISPAVGQMSRKCWPPLSPHCRRSLNAYSLLSGGSAGAVW
ncbi:hypothetical protein AU197_00970 [Mycobacterium sp. IS-1590]|nr:hypothetical protein AU197_00970 [Mycobacterium sp. IS-1590]